MAQTRTIGDVTVNDGNGLMDNEGLIESLILDCNTAVKQLVGGNYVGWCNTQVLMVQKLANLKKGAKQESDEAHARIAELERANTELNNIIFNLQHKEAST